MSQEPRKARMLLSVVCLTLLWTSNAYGQEQPPPLDPMLQIFDLHTRGRQAAVDKDFEAATDFFKAAAQMKNLKVGWFHLGKALHDQGLCKEARAAFTKAQKAPHVPGMSALQQKELEQSLEEAIEEVGPKCPGEVLIYCSDPAQKVTLDQKPVACGVWLPVEPGSHTAQAQLEGQQPERKTFQVKPEKKASVLFAPPASASGSPQMRAPVPTAPQEPPTGLRIAGWSTGGASLAMFAFGGWQFLSSQSARSDVERLSGQLAPDSNAYNKALQSYDDERALMWLGLGSGATLAVASGYLLYLGYGGSGEAPPPPEEQAAWRWWVSPTGAGVDVEF